jgi:hypothetical protein
MQALIRFIYITTLKLMLVNDKHIIFLLAGFLLASSCTEKVDIKLDNSFIRLVVEGGISTDTMAHEVKLARTAAYFSTKPPDPVLGANVVIYDSLNQFVLKENPSKPGYYETDPGVFGLPGHTYSLHISNVDINLDGKTEEYSASSLLPPLRKPDSIKVDYVQRFYMNVWEVLFYGQDPVNERNYYMFKIKRNGKLLTDTIRKVGISSDEYYNGVYIKGEPVAILRDLRSNERLNSGDTITLETFGITEGYYYFIVDVYMESRGSDPFGGQPANISTNISNNAVGYFTAMSVARNSYIWKRTK